MAADSKAKPRFVKSVFPWVETVVVTAAIPLVGYWFNPEDPFLLSVGFPWVILAPILLGSRYGFAHGFGSAAFLVAGLGAAWHFNLLPTETFPTALGLGLLFTGIVTGEFGQHWARRFEHFNTRCQYLQTRLDEFSRVYQVLKVSHAHLERQVEGASVSLRTSLLSFRDYLSNCQFRDDEPLGGVGERILRIFRECGGVQMASLYQVTPPFGADKSPVAQLGSPPLFIASNPLVREAIRTGQTVSFKGGSHTPAADELLAAVPLVDIYDRVWGVVAINEMSFSDFQQSTLDVLTIVGGYIGDAMRACSDGGWNGTPVAETFRSQLERSLRDARRHQLPGGLVVMHASNEQLFGLLAKLVKGQSRGLDTVWVLRGNDGSNVVSTLLPLTDKEGIATYVQRLRALLEDMRDPELFDTDFAVSGLALKAEHTASKLIEDIEAIARCGTQAGEESVRFTEWQNAQVV